MKLRFLFLLAVLATATGLGAAERIPPAPPRHFNDYAGVVDRGTADALNRQLEQFERDSSNQLLVVLYPRMESDSSVEDYTVRVAQAWQAGQHGRNNGAVLFAFMQEHQLYIQVGYGLEPKLTDALSKRIIEQEIVPHFRTGDVSGGMTAGVAAMIAATKGEYQGTGATRAQERRANNSNPLVIILVVVLFILHILYANWRRRSGLPFIIGGPSVRPQNSWWTDSGSGSSWGGGDSGGGFSGGGGSFGGGGAGGKW